MVTLASRDKVNEISFQPNFFDEVRIASIARTGSVKGGSCWLFRLPGTNVERGMTVRSTFAERNTTLSFD